MAESNFNNITSIRTYLATYPRDSRIHEIPVDNFFKINPHWILAESQNALQHHAIGAVASMILLLALLGNGILIFLYSRNREMQTASNYLVFNLLIASSIMTLRLPILIYNSFFYGPALGNLACQLYGFIGHISGCCSVNLLTAITLNRYYVVRGYPRTNFTRRLAKIYASSCWSISAFFALMPMLDIGLGSYRYDGFLTTCSVDYLSKDVHIRAYILIFVISEWAVPFVITGFLFMNIVVEIIENSVRGLVRIRKNSNNTYTFKDEFKLTLVIFMSVVAWVVTWSPYFTILMLGITGKGSVLTQVVPMICGVLTNLFCVLNPIIYAIAHPKFRKEIKIFFCRTCTRHRRDSMSMQSSNFPSSLLDFPRDYIDAAVPGPSRQATVAVMADRESGNDPPRLKRTCTPKHPHRKKKQCNSPYMSMSDLNIRPPSRCRTLHECESPAERDVERNLSSSL